MADVVLVVLNREFLDSAVKNLNRDKVKLRAIILDISDESDEKFFTFGESKVPLYTILSLNRLIKKHTDAYFLISGYENNIGDVSRMKNFLVSNGLDESRIVNFELSTQISKTWLANLRHIEQHGADFFATGNEYTRNGLNLNFIPRVHVKESDNLGGVILADEHQDLHQSYLTAKHVFKHVKAGTIKFVLIGLSPNAFHYDSTKDFSNYAKNFQYTLALNLKDESEHTRLLKKLISDEFKKDFLSTTSEQADLNFDTIKNTIDLKLSAKGIMSWEDDSQSITPTSFDKNIQAIMDYIDFCSQKIEILKNYIELCKKNKAKPVGVVFPFSEIARKNYNKELLAFFRETLKQLEKDYNFMYVDWFSHLGYDCFYEMSHLNLKGNQLMNALLSMKLNLAKIIPLKSFLDMNYDYFYSLSLTAPKKEYNPFMDKIFAESVKIIRQKDKIKVGFVLIEAGQWCGDDLHNYFVQDERFETTIFACFNFHKLKTESVIEDFWHGIEQLKQHGLTVIPVHNLDDIVPEQDILIYLTPYLLWMPLAFQLSNVNVKTLTVHMPYGIGMALRGKWYYSLELFAIIWKLFFTSTIELEIYDKEVQKGMPRGFYSGFPRMDFFFEDKENFQFEWKMARPDAKKIIWSPHHSIVGDRGPMAMRYATFQWNYQFMYEFAKAHPEISWVVKPHPWLLFSAVKENIFPSVEAFKEYMQKWNDLPNAQVYTGGYYQALFATSDGIINDSGSFTVEYQYVHKPMILLTRDTQKYNKLGSEIRRVSYLVDGKDLESIAAIIQKVFIEGDDYKANEREKVFDEYLNYQKHNGMLASEFIYKSIADEFKED